MSNLLHCRYCKRQLISPANDPGRNQPLSATRDHIIAKSRGGTLTDWCCLQCNHLKANMSLIEWARFMQAYPGWWDRFRHRWQISRAEARRLGGFPFRLEQPPICRGLVA